MIQVPPLVFPVNVFVTMLAAALARSGARNLRVSSWLRTQVLDEGAGPRSLHLRGLAMDLIGADTAAFAAAWRSFGLDAVVESDHLHVEFDGPSLRALGFDFRP